jgi:hypothetical protein
LNTGCHQGIIKKMLQEEEIMKSPMLVIIIICTVLAVATVSLAIHEEVPSGSQPVEGEGVTLLTPKGASPDATTLKALINLLEKKGVITKEELRNEIEQLQGGR